MRFTILIIRQITLKVVKWEDWFSLLLCAFQCKATIIWKLQTRQNPKVFRFICIRTKQQKHSRGRIQINLKSSLTIKVRVSLGDLVDVIKENFTQKNLRNIIHKKATDSVFDNDGKFSRTSTITYAVTRVYPVHQHDRQEVSDFQSDCTPPDSITPKKWESAPFPNSWESRDGPLCCFCLSFTASLPSSPSVYYPFHGAMSSHLEPQMNGARGLITFPLYNFKWLYLDTSHFLCKARHPASHNPMMQPLIDLREVGGRTRCRVECASDARGKSAEAVFSKNAFHMFRQTVKITHYPRSYQVSWADMICFMWEIAEGCPVLLWPVIICTAWSQLEVRGMELVSSQR